MPLDENYTFNDFMFDEHAFEEYEEEEYEENDDYEYLKNLGYYN